MGRYDCKLLKPFSFGASNTHGGRTSVRNSLAVSFLILASTAFSQDVASGKQIVDQKCDTCHTLRDEQKQPVLGLLAGGKIIRYCPPGA